MEDTGNEQWLHYNVARGTPRDLPRCDVNIDEVHLQQQVVELVKQDRND